MFRNFMLKAKLNEYIEKYETEAESEEDNKRKYICNTFFSQIQPERLDRDYDLLSQICGDECKNGVIGKAITMNNQIITTFTDIDDILQKESKVQFDIYVLAYKGIMTDEEIVNSIFESPKDDVEFGKIVKHMYEQKVVSRWEELPNLNIVYFTEKVEEPRILKRDNCILNILCLNEEKLLRIAKSNENEYKVKFEYKEGFPVPKVPNGEKANVILCGADEFLKILMNEDGLIRGNIFDENVRAYQGDTEVNKEIVKTLEENPDSFVLYNNGITIVCSTFVLDGKSITIKNPQIVNGCQTSNSIYKAKRAKVDVSRVDVIVKVISAMEKDVTQGIVKGTNRQNIVYEEAFETIKKFHKDLEDFFNITETQGFKKIYYERRSKQYAEESRVKPYQKVNLRNLIQSVVAMYMNKVEVSHRHESKLLSDYKNKLFVEGQSFYPYYVAALLSANLEFVMKNNSKYKDIKRYKKHILFIIQEQTMGKAPDINDYDGIEKYCKQLLDILSKNGFEEAVRKAADTFTILLEKWVEKKGDNYRFFVKDNPEFTDFMLENLRGTKRVTEPDIMCRGRILNITTDKNGYLFGFISHKPENIYFNELDNNDIDISYEGKQVSYRIKEVFGKKRAFDIKML